MPEVETPERGSPLPDAPAPAEEAQTPEPQPPEEEPPPEEQEERPPEPDLGALLEKADPEFLRKHKRIAGIAGEMAQKMAQREAVRLAEHRAQQLVQEREQLREAEASRRQLIEAAKKGEFYALGEQVSKNLLVEDQQRYIGTYQTQARNEAYGSVQQVVDEMAQGFDPEVIQAAAAAVEDLQPGQPWQVGFGKWLPALVKAQAQFLASNPETRKQVAREVIPAVRSRALAELNGSEPVADGGGGRAQRQRTVTDEDIARMEPEEWMAVYDVKAGRFKPGVVYKPTRAVDPTGMRNTSRSL